MQDEIVERAFNESFWLGIAVVLVTSNLGFLIFAVKYFWRQVKEERQSKDALRDKYESQQRDDLKLFLEVQNTLKNFHGESIERLLTEIKTKVDLLVTKQ